MLRADTTIRSSADILRATWHLRSTHNMFASSSARTPTYAFVYFALEKSLNCIALGARGTVLF